MLRLRSVLSRPGQPDLDEVFVHKDRIAANFDARIVRPGAVRQAKAPGVPGTGDDAFFQVAAAQGSAHVRADIVDGIVLALYPKYGDQLVPKGNGLAFPVGHVIDPANRVKIAHVPLANPSGPQTGTLS